jgi:hypothetical protein
MFIAFYYCAQIMDPSPLFPWDFQEDGTSTALDVVRYAEGHLENFGVTYS